MSDLELGVDRRVAEDFEANREKRQKAVIEAMRLSSDGVSLWDLGSRGVITPAEAAYEVYDMVTAYNMACVKDPNIMLFGLMYSMAEMVAMFPKKYRVQIWKKMSETGMEFMRDMYPQEGQVCEADAKLAAGLAQALAV